MNLNQLSKAVLCFFILFQFGFAIAQQTGSNSDSKPAGLSLDFSSEIGGFYFQDVNGFQIALEGVPYEGEIDNEKYILGSNDLISIEIESTQNIVLKSVLVNLSGDIVIPSVGVIKVGGSTITEAEPLVQKKISKTFKNPKVTISLEIPRKVIVHISGSIPNPGKYVIPAQSRVDLAVIQSILDIKKDINSELNYGSFASELLRYKQYSLRNIKIQKIDGSTHRADLVEYFRTGNLSSNPIINDGDKVIIDRISENTPTISITGAVRYGYNLEYKSGEKISDLLKITEYFEENADSSKVIVYRNQDDEINQIEVPDSDWDTFDLKPNDRVIVPKIHGPRPTSTAWVNGEINNPGNYPIISGQTSLKKLLDMSGGITNKALLHASYLVRGSNLENEMPNKFNAQLMSRTSNQYVQGLEYLQLETQLTENRVQVDLSNENELENIVLFDDDRLFIPRDEQTVFVFGQVNNPGYFPYYEQNTPSISQYITRAGGFALSADQDRIFILKAGNLAWYKPGDTELESGDKIFVDRYPVEDLYALRTYEVQKEQIKNTRIQLIMTAITTITGIITTYVAIQNIR